MKKERRKGNMAKGIYKRGKVFWIRYAGLDGKIVFESSHSDKFKEAQDQLIQRKGEIKDGKQPEIKKKIPNHTFRELAQEHIKWTERQRAFKQKQQVVNQLTETFGNIPLRHFNTRLLEQYQTDRLQKGNKKVKVGENEWRYPPNKPATTNRHLAVIKHMFTKAVQWEMVEEYALKKVRQVKLLEENNRRLRYLSKEECKALINDCNSHLKPIVITAINTGMRKGEILSLKWDNVDLKHGFILLDRTKNGERREIPINDTLRTILQGLTRRLDVPCVFFDIGTGKPFQDVKRSFNTACRRAGIKDFHFHDLRHTFASHLVMAGIDITTIKELLGHKTLTMTLRYAHLAPSHKVNAVNILDNALNENPTIQKLYKKEAVSHV
jgi:integrase